MPLSKTMQQAIESGDLNIIYSSFYTILLSDPGFSTNKFEEVFNIVKEQDIPGFLQPFDGKTFEETSEWTQEYWDKVASELMDNFSLERIEFLQKIGKEVFNASMIQETDAGIDQTSKKKGDMKSEERDYTTNKGKWILAVVIIFLIIAIVLIV